MNERRHTGSRRAPDERRRVPDPMLTVHPLSAPLRNEQLLSDITRRNRIKSSLEAPNNKVTLRCEALGQEYFVAAMYFLQTSDTSCRVKGEYEALLCPSLTVLCSVQGGGEHQWCPHPVACERRGLPAFLRYQRHDDVVPAGR